MALSQTRAAPDIDLRLQYHARSRPDAPALADARDSLTWGELDRRVNRLANAFIAEGLQPQDTVALLGRNSLDYGVAMLAVLRAGGCIVPLSTLSIPEVSVTMVTDAKARFLVTDTHGHASLDGLASSLVLKGVEELALEAGSGRRSLADLAAIASIEPPVLSPAADWGFNLIYSSGTTGRPKGILQSRGYRAEESLRIAEGAGMDASTRTIISTPLYSNTTLFLLFAVLAAGGFARLMDKFDAEDFLATSEQVRPTHAVLVPVQYERLLDHPCFDTFDLSSFRAKFSTSAPLHPARKREILDRWPSGGLIEIYGMTEGGVSCVLVAHERQDKLDSVGRPAPGCDLKIIADDGREASAGQPGEVVGRSATMMTGYHGLDQATQDASWFSPDGARYHRSGDIGFLDDEGFLHLLDRKKDVIISGGFNIYATDLEAVVSQHPDVVGVAVVAMPSPTWGETPAAFLVLGADGEGPEQVRSWANARLGKAQRIHHAQAIPTLPRSSIGKILKRELRDLLPSHSLVGEF